jgi:CHAT domain-containing protein
MGRAVVRFSVIVLLSTAVMAFAPPVFAQRSVDEAIKVIDSFRVDTKDQKNGDAAATPVSLAPPPRTIADITDILDKQKPDAAKRAANIAAADAQPAAGATPTELANFYFQRAVAAGDVGRLIQRRDDAREALRLGREARVAPKQISFYLNTLTSAEKSTGNIRATIALSEERWNTGAHGSMQRVGAAANLAIAYAQLGNLADANNWARQSDNALADTAANRNMAQVFRDQGRVATMQARIAIAEVSGQLVEAEAGSRNTLRYLETQILPNEAMSNQMGGLPLGTYTRITDRQRAELARILLRQGRLIEAETEQRRALLNELSQHGRYSPEVGTLVQELAVIIHEQGRYKEAEQLARSALDIYEQIGTDRTSGGVSGTRQQIAQAQASEGKWADAFTTYDALRQDIQGDELLKTRFLDANINYAVVLLHNDHAADAVPILERKIEKSTKLLGERHYNTAEARAWLGVALLKAGRAPQALTQFETAVPILLASSRQTTEDDGGGGVDGERRRQEIIEAYMTALVDARGDAAAAETFHLADAIRGQSVERALAASSARAAAADPVLADFVRHEQDAQKQVAALNGLVADIVTLPTSEQDAGALQKLRGQIDQLRGARARVREEIEHRFPGYANLVNPKPSTLEQARKGLRQGEALIATYAGADRLFVWAVPAQGQAVFAAVKVSDRELEKLVADLRKSLDPNATTLDEVPAFNVAEAYRLYELLLKPVEAGWKDAQSLLIVPHKALGQLPASLLVTQAIAQPAKTAVPFAEYKAVPFLARKVAVTQLPSVSSLATLRGLPAPAANREVLAAFGDPWFNPEQAAEAKKQYQQVAQAGALQTRGIPLIRRSAPKTDVDSAELALLPRLPDTADEVKSIALALHADLTKDVFIGEAANEKTVKGMDLSKRKIIMFATHGLVPGDLNGLTQPALALTAPAVAKVDGDGLLTMEEILALKLNADWVVLSACNTASGVGAGAEAVSGLGRAFFYAGTRALLVSNWPVETASARILTTDLFRRQADAPTLARAEAMRQAELALIDGPGAADPTTKQPLFSYAHPIFWAPFTVVGDGG